MPPLLSTALPPLLSTALLRFCPRLCFRFCPRLCLRFCQRLCLRFLSSASLPRFCLLWGRRAPRAVGKMPPSLGPQLMPSESSQCRGFEGISPHALTLLLPLGVSCLGLAQWKVCSMDGLGTHLTRAVRLSHASTSTHVVDVYHVVLLSTLSTIIKSVITLEWQGMPSAGGCRSGCVRPG